MSRDDLDGRGALPFLFGAGVKEAPHLQKRLQKLSFLMTKLVNFTLGKPDLGWHPDSPSPTDRVLIRRKAITKPEN